MPNSDHWCLIFSDGTGQRGVRDNPAIRNTNVFQMFVAVDETPGFECFYDAGLGAPVEGSWGWSRTFRNLWSKATGWGITANIVDCYEALMLKWKPGMKVGLFGFSRGAYTVRCLGGVLGTCGIAMSDGGAPISKEEEGSGAERRRQIAEEAVAAYKIKDERARKAAGEKFAQRYRAEAVIPEVIGVFDTVKALGLPGIMNAANPYKHEFHDTELSTRIRVGLQALSIDENRKEFAPVLWDDLSPEAIQAGQVIEQCWFPGVHSDVGGGYDDDSNLSDVALAWMLGRLRELTGLHFPITIEPEGKILGKAHNERTGFGIFWIPGERSIRGEAVDIAALCEKLETRFDKHAPPYRPNALRRHPRTKPYY
jgi:uncharacterized protein (DUF2235 family)